MSRLLAAGLLAAGLFAAGCASAPRPRPAPSSRMADSAPEKIAAQRAAAPGLQLEQDDARWGVEAARERQAAEKQKKRQPPAAAAATPTGPVDLRQTPDGKPAPRP